MLTTAKDKNSRDAKRGLQLAEEVLTAESQNPYALNAKACALALQGNWKQAIELEQQALKNSDYAADSGLDGGALAKERILSWQKNELWVK